MSERTNRNGHSSDGVTSSIGDLSHTHGEHNWGVAKGYWLWPTTVKILFVIDGRIRLDKNPFEFGLGYVLESLINPFSFWVRLEVDIAKRDGDLTVAPGEYELSYADFKFTDAGFQLDSYDQVWFFGDLPNAFDGADNVTTDADIPGPFALDDAELKLLAEWMDRGGGVFATGDHSILGATMCSRIPRVRTMRRWTHAQGVPGRDGSTRHSTLQPTGSTDREGDTVLQPVKLVYQPVAGVSAVMGPVMPHPLLCSTLGAIDRFPDHMHEGEVFRNKDVLLDRPLNIAGYDRPEYPFMPQVGSLAPGRPRPQVIAYGETTNNELVFDMRRLTLAGVSDEVSQPFGPKQFGLVSVYDGDAVGLGRVVVDSTWHHWFSYNLASIANGSTPAYQKMQAYYRNVGLWLAKPAQRQAMLISGTWGVLTGSAPMEFSPKDNPWYIGEHVLSIFGITASACIVNDFVQTSVNHKANSQLAAPKELHPSEPFWSMLSADLVNRAIVGGIGSALVELALEHREKRSRGQRPRLDGKAIRERSIEGLLRGRAMLITTVDDAMKAFNTIKANLTAIESQPPIEVIIPINRHRLSVKADKLQFPDPRDPELVGGYVTFTIRVVLDGVLVAHQVYEDMLLPPFDVHGCLIDLNTRLADLEVQTGERLSIEVIAGSWPSENAGPQDIRFRAPMQGAVCSWLGAKAPARSQVWRLWFSIEELHRY